MSSHAHLNALFATEFSGVCTTWKIIGAHTVRDDDLFECLEYFKTIKFDLFHIAAGEKPYRCDVCNHDVTTKSQLDRHCKTISHINKLNESMGADNRQNYM